MSDVLPPDRPDIPGSEQVRVYQPSSRRFNKALLPDGEKDYLECWGYRSTLLRTLLYYVCSLTGIGCLILLWFPKLKLRVGKSQCCHQDADSVLIKDTHNTYYACKIYRDILTTNAKWICDDLLEFGLLEEKPQKTEKSAKILHLELVQLSDAIKSPCIHREEKCSGKEGQPSKTCYIRYFDHQHVRYAWHQAEETFKRLSGVSPTLTCGDIQTRTVGVTEEVRNQKLSFFGCNVIDVEVKSVFRLLVEEVLNPFYVFQVFCIVLWCLDDYYYYASCVLAVSLFGIILSLYETRKQRIRLREMVGKSQTKESFMVIKADGEFGLIRPEMLVPGDIIVIPHHGCLMPCDAVLIAGNCIVNEGVLTGESAPVTKVALHGLDCEKFSSDEHKRHILFHGTSVIQTRYYEGARVLAVVVQTGFYTVKGELVRSILFPKPMGFKFYRDAMRLVGVLAGIAGCGMAYSLYINIQREDLFAEGADPTNGIFKTILRALDLITIVVPPALPAALTVGIVYSQRRLKDSGIFCISPSRINVCGKIKLVCFDKTGTLTEEGLDLMGVIPAEDGELGTMVEEPETIERTHPIISGMATCHSLTMINGQLSGDPLDVKLFEATGWKLHEPLQKNEPTGAFNTLFPTTVSPPSNSPEASVNGTIGLVERHTGIVRQFPFSSGMQRMSVVTRAPDEECFRLYAKGAPEKIVSLCKPSTVPVNFYQILRTYTHQGYRVIALASRELDYKIPYHQIARLKRDAVECDLEFVGLTIMRNSLKEETSSVIAELNAADVQTVMVTGDNLLTAVSVARECGMVGKDENIVLVDVLPPDEVTDSPAHVKWRYADSALSSSETSIPDMDSETSSSPSRAISADEYLISVERPRYHFGMTGRSFGALVQYFPELIPKILVYGTVFARFSPDQKTELVEKYIDLDYITAMVGDGANDCGALKAAHAGISLSEAEASVASPFTSQKNTIECVPNVIREGRCALVTSFGVFKYMALYSIVQFVAVLILYEKFTIPADSHFLYLDLVITTTVAVLMGYTRPFDKMVAQRPSGSLMAPATIASIFFHMLIVIGFQSMAIVFLQVQPWFVQANKGTVAEGGEIKLAWETTVLFLVAAFQDLILAFVFSKGSPYRKPVYTNLWFLSALVFLVSLTTLLLLYVPQWLQDLLQVVYDFSNPRMVFRLVILGLMVANFIAALILEEFIVDRTWFPRVIRTLRRKTQSKSKFKLIRRQLMMKPNWPPVGETTCAKTKTPDLDASIDSAANCTKL